MRFDTTPYPASLVRNMQSYLLCLEPRPSFRERCGGQAWATPQEVYRPPADLLPPAAWRPPVYRAPAPVQIQENICGKATISQKGLLSGYRRIAVRPQASRCRVLPVPATAFLGLPGPSGAVVKPSSGSGKHRLGREHVLRLLPALIPKASRVEISGQKPASGSRFLT